MIHSPHAQRDVLFVSEQPPWPLDQGFKVHGYHMARALRDLGVRVGFASMQPLPDDAPEPLRQMHVDWPKATAHQTQTRSRRFRGLRRRLARYLGPSQADAAGLLALVGQCQPQAVVGLGIHSPILLHGLHARVPCKRVWYAADELLYFHASCMRRESVWRWPGRLRQAAVHVAMERLFAAGLDGAIAVSPTDAKMLRFVAGVRNVVTVRNGVDLDDFAPHPAQPRQQSLIFWGNLDFEPNVDAVRWFARCVWPKLHWRRPDATLRIVGRNAVPAVNELAAQPGIDVVGAVDDIREAARDSSAVVLPMRCGGGIKNKLLEAAAMGKPIVASPRAADGLAFDDTGPPFAIADTPEAWVAAVRRVWSDPLHAAALGAAARAWVRKHHNWNAAAAHLAAWLGVDTQTTRSQADARAA